MCIRIILAFFIFFAQFSFSISDEDDVYTPYKLYADFGKYFTKQNCSIILDRFYYVNCYDYGLKGSKAVAYELKGDILKMGPAAKRPPFKSDMQIPLQYRTTTRDYTNSGYDRGHILSNQSMNATIQAQASTFLMSNITPQNPQINRGIWKKAEDRERALAKEEGDEQVLNLIIYPPHPHYIKNQIAVPQSYVKIIETSKTKECYEIPNQDVKDKVLKDYIVDCDAFVK
ncbi:DNA/RNA non-specific endonuclease [Helicobacter sp. 13S00477-4]|uniref:DNA/RNA non-specific endonuclease n=1 Tax=Helicobacter sp. 13S00477-4 TaxID=1905759 RepID=UPI000BA54B44|nr:DNA/RNA non-specific endonuclease [Helicobacter sp. 13S00477-4]PAF52337.1 endonuclease [Helicobacter sp. 13S00477-4]